MSIICENSIVPNKLKHFVKDTRSAYVEPGWLPYRASVLLLLQQELGKEHPSLLRINSLVAQDPALTALVLAHVNRELSLELGSAAQALALLDTGNIARLLLDKQSHSYATRLKWGFPAAAWCDYSVQVAEVARSLAVDLGLSGAEAYTCGLLHATGELVMHLFPRQEVRTLDTEVDVFCLERSQHEKRVLGYSYAKFSNKLASQWALPETIVKAISHHEAPFKYGNYLPMTCVLHLAVWRVRADKEAAQDNQVYGRTFPFEVALALDMDMDMVLQQDAFDWHSVEIFA